MDERRRLGELEDVGKPRGRSGDQRRRTGDALKGAFLAVRGLVRGEDRRS